jgi:hypothetical protein
MGSRDGVASPLYGSVERALRGDMKAVIGNRRTEEGGHQLHRHATGELETRVEELSTALCGSVGGLTRAFRVGG